jgi:hypothetical protein
MLFHGYDFIELHVIPKFILKNVSLLQCLFFLFQITESSNITIDNASSQLFTPYSELSISITALTYWSSAKATVTKKRVPPSKPSAPLNPRGFIIPKPQFPYKNSSSSSLPSQLELRWDPPSSPNGLILGYFVSCWKNGIKLTDCICDVDMNSLSCHLQSSRDLELDKSTISFSVQAYTSAGPGLGSTKVGISSGGGSGSSHSVPKLLLTSADKIEVLDIDRKERTGISLGYIAPILTAGFLASDETLFWFNEGQDLMMAKMNGSPGYNKTRLLSLSGSWETSHLTVDWVGRRLYWAVEAASSGSKSLSLEFKYGIMTFDLADLESGSSSLQLRRHYKPQVYILSNKYGK